MTAAKACATVTANRIDFIDKDNAGRMFFRLLEEIANTGRADTDKHFHEIRAADIEEGHPASPAMARQQGLSRARGPTAGRPWECGRRAFETSADL